MAHHNYLIGHNTNPDRNKTNPSRLTALTPQNQPERPLLRGNQSKVDTLVDSLRSAPPPKPIRISFHSLHCLHPGTNWLELVEAAGPSMEVRESRVEADPAHHFGQITKEPLNNPLQAVGYEQ